MRHRFISDPQDPFSDPNTGWDDTNFFPASFYPAFHPATGHGGGSPPAPTPLVISLSPTLPAESIQAQAAVSGSGSGGTGSVVAETSSSGFTINLIFDSAAMAAPSSFRAGIEQAASILSATITNKISVNLNIDYSGTGGGAAAGPYDIQRSAECIIDPGAIAGRSLERAAEAFRAAWCHRHHHRRRQRHLCDRHSIEPAGWRCAARVDARAWPRALWCVIQRICTRYFRLLPLYEPRNEPVLGQHSFLCCLFFRERWQYETG